MAREWVALSRSYKGSMLLGTFRPILRSLSFDIYIPPSRDDRARALGEGEASSQGQR
jgi:hypothetical protein